ncbi:LacI family transcriptional regulator [Psychromonas sp. B3M02]|uniref:LacI family DNA-binding transcriptional regulator n=1 Tax=unclassified Psychromonas TaxID=2614957 RepID=UPI000DE9959D|nr:LacI family DNA-binding transcriptional regulator [Psychromonas sp. B3M02]RBW47023.1 LacI family transcriptional regulator [Psychromonas sp. B3M02]
MSIKQLADYLGLSKSTVSRALNGYSDVNADTRLKVLEAAKILGYRANPTAQRLASGRSKNIGIILPANARMFVSSAFSKVLASASEFLITQGYQLIVTTISDTQDEQKVYFDFITSGLVDGLFIVRTRHNDPRITLLNVHHFPYVCLGYESGYQDERFVDVDNQDAFYQLTQRQINAGHQRIAFLNGPDQLTLATARQLGYLKAMQEASLTVEQGYLLHGELTERDAIEMTKQLMALTQPPSCILCADDAMALGAMVACENLGYQPGVDIAIAGYGNYEHSQYTKPSITTLDYDTHGVGKQISKLILNQLEGKNFTIQNWYQASIIIGESDLLKDKPIC